MYINFNYLKSKDINPIEFVTLVCIRQMKWEPERVDDLALVLTDEIEEKFTERGYITKIKGKKKDLELSKFRLTSKGNKFLDNAQTPNITEETLKIFDWVKKVYLAEGKEIGNQKKCKSYIAQFAKESGIVRNHLAHLIKSFLFSESEMEYSHKLEYLFFKGSSVFSTKFDLHQSRLYQFYEKNKEEFDKDFSNIKN